MIDSLSVCPHHSKLMKLDCHIKLLKYYLIMSLKQILTLDQLSDIICQRHNDAQQHLRGDYMAARNIQRYYRGYRTRKYIKNLNRNAAIIQKYVRGYLSRKHYSVLLEETLQNRFEAHYNRSATTIQRRFRGYYSRKYSFDFYRMKSWLAKLVIKNEQVEEDTWNYFYDERNRKEQELNEMARELCIFIGKKLHHLLRTHQRAGIYSNANSSALSNIERLLASFSFVKFNQDRRATKAAQKARFVAAVNENYARTQAGRSRYARCEVHWRSRNVDQFEQAGRPREKIDTKTAMRGGQIQRPYVKSMLATEKYCGDIIEMTRQFDILSPGRDFTLNTKIVQKPERIEEFIEVLHDFCMLHNLVGK